MESTRLVVTAGRGPSSTVAGLARVARRILDVVFFAVLPAGLGALVLVSAVRHGFFGFDFKGTIWQPGRDALAGRSPYPQPRLDAVEVGNPSVYPPLAIVVGVPFALLRFTAACWVWAAVLAACVAVTLRQLGVRDWRCYTLAAGSAPVVFGLVFGNLSLLLVPLAAYAWRRRDVTLPTAVAVGAAIALKIVVWPLLVWLVVTRRARAAILALAGVVAATAVAWAALGFAGLREYPHLLAVNADFFSRVSWSVVAGGIGAGLAPPTARALSLFVGLALLALTAFVARGADGDRRAFSVALVASFALTPIVWPYYFAVLLVPVALRSRRFDWSWLLFALLWIAQLVPRPLARSTPAPEGVPPLLWQVNHSPPPAGQIAVATALIALLTVSLVRRSTRPSDSCARSAGQLAPLPDSTRYGAFNRRVSSGTAAEAAPAGRSRSDGLKVGRETNLDPGRTARPLIPK